MDSDNTYAAADSNADSDIDLESGSDPSRPASLLWPDQVAGVVLHTVLPLERPEVTNEMIIGYNTS